MLAQRCGDRGTERSSEFGSVDHIRCPHARARGARRFQRAPTQTDLHRPAGRRCGCWPTSPFLFSGIVVRRFGGDDGARAIGADADVGFAWSGAGAGRAQRGTGSSTTIGKSAAPTVGALSLRSRSAAAAAALNDHRNLAALIIFAALTRAREARADSSELRRRPTCTGRLGGAAAAGRRRHFFLAELLFADSGATMELGRSAPMLTSASPGRWCRRRSSAGRYGVIDNDRKFCSTDSGGALACSRSAAATAALNDHRNLAALTIFAALTRAREARADSSEL